ncbi:hypothetical protein PENTCL1PPCAC_4116, partial [Pristionchus entomophagus]
FQKRHYGRLALGLDSTREEEVREEEPKRKNTKTESILIIDEKIHDLNDFISPSITRPCTKPYHNGYTFVVGHINEKLPSNVSVISRKTCASCMGLLPLDSRSADSVVIYHRERMFQRSTDGHFIGKDAIGYV